MKSILPLLILLVVISGCAERDDVYVTPYIVSIDPPVRKLPDDLVQSPWGPRPNHVVQVNEAALRPSPLRSRRPLETYGSISPVTRSVPKNTSCRARILS